MTAETELRKPDVVTVRFGLDRSEEHHVNCPLEADWLPILGPTAWLLSQLVLRELGDVPTNIAIEWDTTKLARRLGVGPSIASNGNVPRAIARLVRFGVVTLDTDGVVRIKRGWGNPPRRRHNH